MSGRASAEVTRAVAMLRESGGTMTAYAAAKAVGIALSTIYRSPLYKAYRTEQDQSTHKPKEEP
jgi:hypothetical protein